ncbi:WD40 repeat-like protein [Suillus weaverae]|nr:WD40 repeat-like protein [Suillus weaverae]
MNEDNPPRKKRWDSSLKQSRSDPHLAEERRAISDPSSLPPSRNGSRRGLSRLVHKLFGKVTNRVARSARQSPNPEPTATSSSEQDPLHPQTSQDLSPPTTTTLEQNLRQSSNLHVPKSEQPDPKLVKATLANAKAGLEGIRHVSGMVENAALASDNLQSVSDTIDMFSTILGPLKVFNSIATGLADVHPYAKVALSIFTCASKMILDQANRDDAVLGLLTKISDVYAFIMEEEELAKIESMLAIYGNIAKQTLECADFISHYSETKSAWIRLGKHVFDETDATVQSYSDVLDSLMQQFRDRAARDTVVMVHHMSEDLDFTGMEYAAGAGLNTSKRCLPGTRDDILSEIKSWICSTGKDVQRVLWLSGTAGKGKSAIAHTIANWSNEQGGLGACFCFDRTRGADRRHEKIFTTIARDLADCNPTMRRALARAVHDRNELRHTTDIARQWQELIVGPTSMTPKDIALPVLIIIEALDESGEADSREQILCLLAGKLNTSPSQLAELPENFRFLVTSRPLEDIHNTLHTAPHVRHVSLDDVSSASTEHDIQVYISDRLKYLRNIFNDAHFKTLALKSDGLFEWARLACEYIRGTNTVRLNPMNRFEAVVARTSAKGTRLLDDMYRCILADSMPKDEREETIPVFRSVMAQILASLEPLSMAALTAMRLYFPCVDDRYDVQQVIGSLGSLLNGTTDSQIPIRPLHASFYDFLADASRSHDFFVDTSSVQSDLAFASFRVMEHGLRFNICSLENSYLPNSSIPDLEKRVKESIPAELSYSCRFFGTHLGATSFEASLAREVEAFLDAERLLWWLEALALMKCVSGSSDTLSSMSNWVASKGRAEYMWIGDAARDLQRFVRTFGATIVHSTPHLYLSALPFSPTESRIFKKFATKFPCIPRIVAGHIVNWPRMEKILISNSEVYSLAMSPDGKRIACGLSDGTIQVWDIETGEALDAPLQGHTSHVASVAFSPDGKCIVSGSGDQTIRVWDAKTGVPLGSPLHGHTSRVQSIAISRDGKRIVSGSEDNTIRVWDIETGKAFGAPLQGHTKGVLSVTISPDGHRIVSGSDDMTIRVWDVETSEALGAPLQGHAGPVSSVAISPDGKHIVSGSEDKTIRVWDMETGEAFGAPLQGHTNGVLSVTISPDGNRIVSGSDRTIRVWDAKTGEALGSPLQGHTGWIWSVAISPDGNRIVSGSIDKTVRVWDVNSIMGNASITTLQSHTDSVTSVAISPDGKHIVSGSNDMTVRVWDMGTGQPSGAPLEGHTDFVQSVAISPDGKRIVSGSDDKTIRMWDMGTGEALSAPLQEYTHSVNSIAISLDGNRIVSGSSDMIQVCSAVQSGEASCAPLTLQGHSLDVKSVAILSDGSHIVSGSMDGTVRVWDLGTDKVSGAPLQGHTGWVLSVAVSPDAKCVVSGSNDKTVRVWDVGTGKALGAPLQGHTEWVYCVAISPNGQWIVSGSDDNTIRMWDMKTGEAVGTPFQGHTDAIMSVAISPDGKRIVSGSYDSTIRVWDIEFLNQPHPFTAPAICFSSNPTHALRAASSFLEDSSTSASVTAKEDGWVVGPDGRLLLWIPLNFHPVVYAPGNTLVIANNPLQLDLSCVAHGMSWHKCREQEAALSS